MSEPVFNWEDALQKAHDDINQYLQIYQPHSLVFQKLIYETLSELAQKVEREVRSSYRQMNMDSAQETARENMELISHILSGEVTFHRREKGDPAKSVEQQENKL